jgi:omega-amidase
VKLKVSIAQIAVAQSRPEENLRKGEGLIAEAAERGSDLVCFPELWTSGFNWSNNKQMAREHAKSIDRVAALASKHKIWINGSMPALNEGGGLSNTSILFSAKGEQAGVYRKAHLFSLHHEERHVEPGDCLTTVETPWGRIGLSVCYDIRFPELFRTYALKGARLVLTPAAFPHPRLPHWKILTRARAIENQMFLVAVNQVGSEDLGADGTVTYFGNSCIIDPWGETVVEAGETSEELLTAPLDLDKADEIRGKMTVLSDRRPDLYELD